MELPNEYSSGGGTGSLAFICGQVSVLDDPGTCPDLLILHRSPAQWNYVSDFPGTSSLLGQSASKPTSWTAMHCPRRLPGAQGQRIFPVTLLPLGAGVSKITSRPSVIRKLC